MAKVTWGTPSPAGTRRFFGRDALRRLTIRGALFAGFGLILVVWSASGVDLVRRLIEVDQRTSAVDVRVTRAEAILSTIRNQVLLGSVYLRDALLDDPDNAPFYRQQLQDIRASVDLALMEYEPVADSLGQREAVGALRAELQDFWTIVLPVVEWDVTRRSAEARTYLRRRVIPKREVINRISEGIQELDRVSVERQRTEVSEIYAAMRWRVWVTSGLALLLTAGVALLVTRYASRLERRIRQQRSQDLQNARDLQRLSAKLVTAQEEERRTIARELHDEIGQSLTAIRLELALAERTLGTGADAVPALKEARAISEGALRAVRDLSQLLHPSLLDDMGLPAALERHLGSFSARTGIPADLLQDRMEDRLAPEVEVCLYRIAQEALTNVARHAGASSCRVYLQRLSRTVVMTVEDDGRGFDPKSGAKDAQHQGLGLLGIQERVTGLRGSFRLESAPGRGTRLTVEFPALPRASRPDVQVDGPSVLSTVDGGS